MTEAMTISLISASSMILAALITSIAVVVGANKLAEKKRVLQNLKRAYRDIEVLYTIEKYHTEIYLTANNKCNKVHIRQLVTNNENITLSGKNTLSQVKRKIEALELSSD